MKIIRDNCAYVQLSDIKSLEQTDMPCPAGIFLKASTKDGLILLNESNRNNFVKYDQDYEVEFFKSIDWIIDYDEVKDLSEQDLLTLMSAASSRQREVSDAINKLPREEQEANKELKREFFTLYYKMYGIRDVILFKQRKTEVTLPEGIEYPNGYKPPLKTSVKKLIKRVKEGISTKFDN